MSFRLKLVLATMLVVGGVTTAALVATQQNITGTYERIFHDRFEDQVRLLAALQETRLAEVKTRFLALSRSVRLLAALEEHANRDAHRGTAGPAAGPADDAAGKGKLYEIAKYEQRDLLAGDAPPVFRIIDERGDVVPPADESAGFVSFAKTAGWERAVAAVSRALSDDEPQRVGYLALDAANGPILHEFVITRIVDPVARRGRGALAIGFPVTELDVPGPPDDADGRGAQKPSDVDAASELKGGILHEGRLYSRTIPEAARAGLAAAVSAAVAGPGAGDTLPFTLDGAPHLVFHRELYPGSELPASYRVVAYSLAEFHAHQRALRWKIVGFGALALLLGLMLSLVLAHRLSVPIRELLGATEEIGAGNLAARVAVRSGDETGRLSAAFNEMAEGLALKERYRSVLDLVSDKTVAQRLMHGDLALGGEIKDVTVLFCDIRGFTALAQGMTPAETIALLNEHMSALTRVVHAHGGVVDKFVGDALMAIFGAPQHDEDHARSAVLAAWSMLEARARLNEHAPEPIAMGIGIASGPVVAGCVGAADRLNYTVVGAQVNLAARLCAHAGGMELLIDEVTRRRLPGEIAVESIPALSLKGLSESVMAYRVTGVAALATAS